MAVGEIGRTILVAVKHGGIAETFHDFACKSARASCPPVLPSHEAIASVDRYQADGLRLVPEIRRPSSGAKLREQALAATTWTSFEECDSEM